MTSFLKQFQDLGYSRDTETMEANEYTSSTGIDGSLKRAIELQEGFTSVNDSMQYNITKDNEFKHNNMVHFHSRRGASLNNSRQYETKLGIHTGNDKHWKHKKENPLLFQPQKQNIFGMQSYTNKIKNRYMPSMYKNGDQLKNTKKLVGKGLNGKNQQGLYNRTRIMPKSVNDLRSLTNQKISYAGDMVESGMKGQKRSAKVNLSKYKKKDFREHKFSDFAKPKLTQINRTIHGKATKKIKNRNSKKSYAGPAKHNVHRNLSAGHFEPTPPAKTTYSYDISNAKAGNKIINNKNSFRNKEDARSEKLNKYEGMISTNNNLYNNSFSPLDATLKEQTSYQYDGNLNMNRNAYNNNYENPDVTLKEQTNYQYDGNLNTNNLNPYNNNYQNPDITLKEQTNFQYDGNLNTNNVNAYNNTLQSPETTLKEQTNFQYDGNLNTNNVNAYNNTLTNPDMTLKEQTNFQYDGNLNTNNVNAYNNTLQNPDTTLKEQTNYQYDGNLNTNTVNAYNNTIQNPDTTLKEQTSFSRDGSINYQNNVYTNAFSNPDMPLKEQTLYNHDGSLNLNSKTYTKDQNMRAKTTLKETTLASYEGNVAKDSGNYFKNNEQARPTIRQSTLIMGYTGGAGTKSKTKTYDAMENFTPLTKNGLKDTFRKPQNKGDGNKNMIGGSKNNLGLVKLKNNQNSDQIKSNGFFNLGTTSRLPTFATSLDRDDQEVHQKEHFINYNPNMKETLQKNPYVNNVAFHSIIY